jgi:hypothetical protein
MSSLLTISVNRRQVQEHQDAPKIIVTSPSYISLDDTWMAIINLSRDNTSFWICVLDTDNPSECYMGEYTLQQYQDLKVLGVSIEQGTKMFQGLMGLMLVFLANPHGYCYYEMPTISNPFMRFIVIPTSDDSIVQYFSLTKIQTSQEQGEYLVRYSLTYNLLN